MRFFILIFIGSVRAHKFHQRVDPNCPDYDLNTACRDICVDDTLKCISSCDPTDSECLSACLREEIVCVETCHPKENLDCPCDNNCPDGCEGCSNSICQCSDVTANEDWNQCLDINGMSLARCIYNCDDNIACEIDCVANFKTKTVDCPCEDNCPSGCPCELYDCDDTSPTITSTTSMATTTTEPSPKEAVLMLCSKTSTNIPMVIGFNGEVDDDIDFTFESGTSVYGSCTTTLNGEMWVLGSTHNNRQMSKIDDCKLKNVGELPFNHYYGGCNTFDFGIMLCFSSHTFEAQQECHSFDGMTFKDEPSSEFPHAYVLSLGSYKGSPFVTGHADSTNGVKTEILDYLSGQWNRAASYPFSNENRISHYATTSTTESVFVLGGHEGITNTYLTTIAEFKNEKWFYVGDLAQGRIQHDAVTSGPFTMIVGGNPTVSSGSSAETEVWDLKSLETKTMKPILYNHSHLGLFLVDGGYCRKN